MDALTGAAIAVFTLVVTSIIQLWRDHQAEQRIINAERRGDARALRDARLLRMREAFKPVVLAAWTLEAAAQQFFVSAGDPKRRADEVIDRVSMDRINEARAELVLGGARDVYDEIQKMYLSFVHMYETIDRPDESLGRDLEIIEGGVKRVEALIAAHLHLAEMPREAV